MFAVFVFLTRPLFDISVMKLTMTTLLFIKVGLQNGYGSMPFHFGPLPHCFHSIISIYANMPVNAYHMRIQVNRAGVWGCKQEAEVGCLYMTAMAESKTRGFFSWVDNKVKLLLKVAHK